MTRRSVFKGFVGLTSGFSGAGWTPLAGVRCNPWLCRFSRSMFPNYIQNRFRVFCRDSEQHLCRALRTPPTLFPIAKRPDTDAHETVNRTGFVGGLFP